MCLSPVTWAFSIAPSNPARRRLLAWLIQVRKFARWFVQKEIGAWKLRFSREWMTETTEALKRGKDRRGWQLNGEACHLEVAMVDADIDGTGWLWEGQEAICRVGCLNLGCGVVVLIAQDGSMTVEDTAEVEWKGSLVTRSSKSSGSLGEPARELSLWEPRWSLTWWRQQQQLTLTEQVYAVLLVSLLERRNKGKKG